MNAKQLAIAEAHMNNKCANKETRDGMVFCHCTSEIKTAETEHCKPNDKAVCWLLDVRKYGLETANAMHADDN